MAKIFGNRMKQSVEAREALVIPTYSLEKKKRHVPKWVMIVSTVALAIFVTIYLPPMLIEEPNLTYRASVDMRQDADRQAMELAQVYLRNNPDADFDNDGLTNEAELNAGTGVYIPDNDNDGTTDYAELYLTETNPIMADTSAIDFVMNADNKTGSAVNTPFKVHDVVMWADDYTSKARGGAIKLSDGSYNFYHFKGWVQFPEAPVAAYKAVNGIQIKLEKNENGYFYIDDSSLVNVRIYTEQPQACHLISFWGKGYQIPDNFFGKALSFIFPSKGFGLITCKPALVNDFDGTWDETAVANDIIKVRLGNFSETRFGRDQQLLTDLSTIFAHIDDGDNVIIQLMSHEVGEIYLEVYGYTNRNNLLVCDPTTGENLGVINISVIGERYLDQSGTITNYEHFYFDGCGYNSASRHRITILDTVNANKTYASDQAQGQLADAPDDLSFLDDLQEQELENGGDAVPVGGESIPETDVGDTMEPEQTSPAE